MAAITRDSIPLAHDIEVATLVQDLALKPIERARSDPPIKDYWEPYFYVSVRQVWRQGVETWVWVEGDTLKRIVITGLKDEGEARALRHEWEYRASGETLAQIVERVVLDVDREARERHQTFLSCLRHVRKYFRWEGGEAVESPGWLLPISRSGLRADDVEILRQVFMRLRDRSFKPNENIMVENGVCPMCGGEEKPKQSVAKSLRSAREKVKQHSGAYADAGFAAWVDQCLQTNTDEWTPARTQLYAHYREWVRKGGHGGNRNEKAEAKASALSEVKWGRLMRQRFPDAYNRRKCGMVYRVTVKRGA